MKHFIVCLLLFTSIYSKAQDADCYSIVLVGTGICNSPYKWNKINITATKAKLLNFIQTTEILHCCANILEGPQMLDRAVKADCPPNIMKIEFTEAADLIQYYKELKENRERNKKKKKDTGAPNDHNDNNNEAKKATEVKEPVEKEPSYGEICVNTNGEISLTVGNGDGSVQITSKGKIYISAKGKGDKEYKVGVN